MTTAPLRVSGGLEAASILSLSILPVFLAWAPALAQDVPPACEDVEAMHVLDFWVGEWEVRTEAGPAGRNRIEKVLAGCALLEHWQGAGGSEGKSLFYFDHAAAEWKQVWVTDRSAGPGGVKEKRLVEVLDGGALRFQGTVRLPDGREYLDRTTLTPLEGGRVRQVIAISTDGGATWQTRFDAVYTPAAPSG